MGENVDTRELEIQILKAKSERLAKDVDELTKKIQGKEISLNEAITELEKHRKELVDCVTLQLGTPIMGPLVAIPTIKIISQIDELITNFKLMSVFGMGL